MNSNLKKLVDIGVDSGHFHSNSNSVESCIRLEDILDLGGNFDDVLFSSKNTDNMMEGSPVTTDDILALGEKIVS